MKIALSVKNSSRVIKPMENDVIIYDGNIWYVTTKENLLKEANETLKKCQQDLEELRRENANFKRDVADQLLQMSNLIEKLYSK